MVLHGKPSTECVERVIVHISCTLMTVHEHLKASSFVIALVLPRPQFSTWQYKSIHICANKMFKMAISVT